MHWITLLRVSWEGCDKNGIRSSGLHVIFNPYFPLPSPKKFRCLHLCQIRWFSVFPAWKIFNHEAIRLLTFKVKCNKMGSGKLWVWHVGTCTLCTSWKVCGILRTYEQLWHMVQTCCTWMRTWRAMAQRQEHCSCSRFPAATWGEQAPSSEPLPNPAHSTAEPGTGRNNSGAAPGSPVTALGDDLLKARSS